MLVRLALLLAALGALSAGCGGKTSDALPPFLCRPCTADADCGEQGNRCLDLAGGGVACGVDCSSTACPSGFLCATVAGGGSNCIPASGQCPDFGPCGGGCTGGWTCDESTNRCIPPWDSGVPDGPPVHVGPWPGQDGDVLDLGDLGMLRFTVAGDTRPADPGAAYPLEVITHIFEQMDQLQPAFGLFVGDYMYVSPTNYEQAAQQLGWFLQARRNLGREVYYVLGNHEAYTHNLEAYRDLMCQAHFYALTGQTSKGSVKFVVLADNRWEPNYQKPFVEEQLARPTTYTFVVHHYPNPDDADIRTTLAAYPVTLELAGHRHTYAYDSRYRRVTVGNAGAPLDSWRDFYGFVLIELQQDGTLLGTAYREDTGMPADTFTVTP